MSKMTIPVLKSVQLDSLKGAKIEDVYALIAGNEYRPMVMLVLEDGRKIRILDGMAFTDSETRIKVNVDLRTFTFESNIFW